MTGDGSQGVLASASGGTPKRGYACNTCQDWGDLVEDADGNPITPIPCPDCAPVPCRCRGTRTVTAVIGLKDAVLLDERPCPDCTRIEVAP